MPTTPHPSYQRLLIPTLAALIGGCSPAAEDTTPVHHPERAGGDRVSTFVCGRDSVGIRFADGTLHMTIHDETFSLVAVEAASGARFVAAGDPGTSFWNKGDRARLEVRGAALPECVLTEAEPTVSAEQQTYRARGNEPGWHMDIGADSIVLNARYGELRVSGPKPAATADDGTTRYETHADGSTLSVAIAPGPCVDSMSGIPHPDTVTVRLDGETLTGCGGEPVALLVDRQWVVEDLSGGLLDDPRATIAFDAAGQVTGRASCNRFGGSYTLTGEALTFGPLAATRMGCAPAIMEQEQRFLAILEAVVAFAIGADGALILAAADGRSITALPAGAATEG